MSSQDDLTTLLAKNELRELTARYCWFATRGDAAGIVPLFAPDASFEIVSDTQPVRVVGHDALREFYKNVPGGLVHPMTGNHLIEVDGAKASGTCDMRNMIRQADGSFAASAGFYEDTYVKLGDGWKFQSRRWHTRVDTAA